MDSNAIEGFEKILKSLIKDATKVSFQEATTPPVDSQLKSQFGGQPYFEEGEEWPICETGQPIDFIFQVFNAPDIKLPNEFKLVQFFYGWHEGPWESKQDGWHVKVYKTLNPEKKLIIPKPHLLEYSKYCELTFEETKSLPGLEGIPLHIDKNIKVLDGIDRSEAWDTYGNLVTKLIGHQPYRSQIGGYPMWVQGEEFPIAKNGKPMNLLFQIASENNADIMWGDVGLIYVFYEEGTDKFEFLLQCT